VTDKQQNNSSFSKTRSLSKITTGTAATDGAGVNLTRIIGSNEIDMVDPFLLLDKFESDNADDYIAGFPDHPHRGFETVTYLLAGRMRHKDNAGHEGVIEPGGVQWMTAGRGIIHSEMPEQENGLLRGFQLWVNLPAAHKMSDPSYQEFSAEQIPVEKLSGGSTVKVIAGQTDSGVSGPVSGIQATPLYIDIDLSANSSFSQKVAEDYHGFIYLIDGDVHLARQEDKLNTGQLGILGPGDGVEITAGDRGARFLLVAGQVINEPVARGGPFVMNSKQEVLQAFDDFRQGRF